MTNPIEQTLEHTKTAVNLLIENGYKPNEYNPHNVGAWLIGNEFGLITIQIGDDVNEALDNAVDNNTLDCMQMNQDDYLEYESKGWDDSYMLLGNASEPFWSEYLWCQKVDTSLIDGMVDSYIDAALWLACDEEESETLSDNYSNDDLSDDCYKQMANDCIEFIYYDKLLTDAYLKTQTIQQFGYDFLLTREGHGAGFWDRGLYELGDKLSNNSKTFGNIDLYIGDDNLIYSM